VIPVRVHLKNFLTYGATAVGEPVVLDFDEATLWSISGQNGAGKTSIFDAITYCLYGEHRGGSQRDERLIRKGASTAEVAFEFRQGGTLYRIRRTVFRRPRRAGGATIVKEVQAAEWDDAERDWRPLPDTGNERGLRAWVDRRLRMSAEVFCSTVLLQQGKADRLLTVDPQKRFDVLANLLDLDVYQRLAGRAADRRRAANANSNAIEVQLAATTEVSADTLQEAREVAGQRAGAARAAEQERARAQAILAGAQTVANLNQAAGDARRQLDTLKEVLAAGDRIRADLAELDKTRAAQEPVRLAAADLDAAAGHDRAADEVDGARQAIDLDASADEADRADARRADAEAERDAAQSRYELLVRHVPLLDRLVGSAAEAVCRRQAATDAGDPEVRARELKEAEAIDRDAVAARRATADTKQAAAEARSERVGHRKVLADQLEGRRSLEGEGVCSRCGQPVTTEHLTRELTELKAAIAVADASIAEAQTILDRAAADLTAAEQAEAEAGQACQRARSALAAAQTAASEAANAERAYAAAAAAAGTLPEAWHAVVDHGEQSAALLADLSAELKELRDKQLPHLRGVAADAADAVARATTALADARTRLQQLAHEAEGARQRATSARQQAQVRLAVVDPALVTEVLADRHGVVDRLAATAARLAPVEDEAARLQQAEGEQRRVTDALNAAMAALAAVPPEHHVEVAAASAALVAASTAADQAAGARDDSRDRLWQLTEQAATRQELEQAHQVARRTGELAKRLEELFGRRGLQAALLEQAKSAIEQLANETLYRISAGQLALTLEVGEAAGNRKLEVFITDAASAEEPLEVAFISGSQKFRAAVALAAGLGQHLAGAEATRALIIDEGFGSLDDLGRQGMIDELHMLASQLDRVIVVSHQADFSDTAYFPNGYSLRKAGRYTEVSRLIA
jgi:DNA repair exonuclease SbcCD ATPase subunit